jgi:hypothetical protein
LFAQRPDPGGDARLLRSSRVLRLTEADFVVRSGRALVFPVYKGTYERIVERPSPNILRDNAIARGKDLRRVIDYIEARPDLDRERIGYYGLRLGAFHGVIGSAIEPRITASVWRRRTDAGEIASRRSTPRLYPLSALMINGRTFSDPLVITDAAFELPNRHGSRASHHLGRARLGQPARSCGLDRSTATSGRWSPRRR